QIADCRLQIADCRLQIADCRFYLRLGPEGSLLWHQSAYSEAWRVLMLIFMWVLISSVLLMSDPLVEAESA
ncbi:MAG: hypothetical protein AB8B36_09890, partial [Prochlorococcus sp.]